MIEYTPVNLHSPGKSTMLNGIYQDVDEDSRGRFVSFKESNYLVGGVNPSEKD